jgi:small subunit ribosomal protein S2
MTKKQENTEEKVEKEDRSGMLLKQDIFLEAGVHIGTRIRTNDMRHFVFKRRDDGLYILDLRKTSERLLSATKILSKYQSEDILLVASRIYSSNPASKFAKLMGVPIIRGRFIPGTLTNMSYKGFTEPKILLVCDPKGEREAISEGAKNGVPIIAMCDTDNETKFVDYIIPINNKGKRSLALAFYVLAREMMMSQGKIKTYDEFPYSLQYFEQMVVEEEKSSVEESEEGSEETVEESEEQEEGKDVPDAQESASGKEKK